MKPSFFLLLMLLFQATVSSANQSALNPIAYIETYKDLAVREMLRTGFPASILLAQAVLASNAGQNEWATDANNHFGTSCGNTWFGDTFTPTAHSTNENCFRAYPTAAASFQDHTQLFTSSEKSRRYHFLFRFEVTDYLNWANGLQLAGYSENVNYAQELIEIIETYKLFQYDIVFYTKKSLPPNYWPVVPEEEEALAAETPDAGYLSNGWTVRPHGFQRKPAGNVVPEEEYRTEERRDLAENQVETPRQPSFTPPEPDVRRSRPAIPLYFHPDADAGFDQDQFSKKDRSSEVIVASYSPGYEVQPTRPFVLQKRSLITAEHHKIGKQDTLWSIARQYKTSVQRLKQLNNLHSDQIRSGDNLRVR